MAVVDSFGSFVVDPLRTVHELPFLNLIFRCQAFHWFYIKNVSQHLIYGYIVDGMTFSYYSFIPLRPRIIISAASFVFTLRCSLTTALIQFKAVVESVLTSIFLSPYFNVKLITFMVASSSATLICETVVLSQSSCILYHLTIHFYYNARGIATCIVPYDSFSCFWDAPPSFSKTSRTTAAVLLTILSSQRVPSAFLFT